MIPPMFHAPGAGAFGAASGTRGEKFAQFTPWTRSGTTPTMNIGTMTRRPIHFCTLAVPRMPRCWIANTASISAAPMKKAAFSESDTGPSVVWNSVQLRMPGVRAATAAAALSASEPDSAPPLAASQSTAAGDVAEGMGAIALRM